MKTFKRTASFLLALVLCAQMAPVTAFAAADAEVTDTADECSITLELSGVCSDAASPETPEDTLYYAACGDSITHANHALVEDIDSDDAHYPIDGYSGTTYARKNYAYYIAESNNLQWANYGYGGTTLHHCYPKGYGGDSMRTYPFVDERIAQLKEDVEWDYISIFFGYNDVIYGPAQQRDFWLKETYGEELGYPVKDSQIGTEGFADAEQKAACDAAIGFVGGVEYTDNTEYFFAKFVGTVDDTETTTFLGAYNYVIDYLSKKYPDAKILIINPYVSGTNNTRKVFRDAVNAIAEKWGLSCMDFSDLPYWFYGVDQERVVFANPHSEDGRWYAENGKANFAGTVEGYNRARFTTDGTHPSNLGYQVISKPIERALIGSDNSVTVLQGESFETELVLDDVYTGMDVSVTMDGTDITDQCYADGKVRIKSVTGNVSIRADGNIVYTVSHTYSAEVTAPTCTEQGYTTYTCVCGDGYATDYVEVTGHTYENGLCSGCGERELTSITLGDFAIAEVGETKLTSSEVLLAQKTLIAVPYCGAELQISVNEGYQVRIHSGDNHNNIDQVSEWLNGGDCYTLPDASIYMRVSVQRTDGGTIVAEELENAGVVVSYVSDSDIVVDNAYAVQILENTDLPVIIHLSDIHGDTIRAGRAANFADAVGADALIASGDLTAYEPDDWGSALFDTMANYPNVDFIYGIGNHDAKVSASTYQEKIYQSYFAENPFTPEGETYYYQDIVDQNLRIISVNQQEGASTTTSGGTCYSQEQVDWLVETLKSTPAGYGVVLMYHSPETTIADAVDPDYTEFFQTDNRYDNPTNNYSGYSGTFLMDLVDAFMLRENFSWSYSEQNGASPIELNADFTSVAEGVEFIAHVTGHLHSDSVIYLPGTACKQLLLGVTCTNSMYGEPGGYYGLADYSDLERIGNTASQDAFNAYVIDRENKTVRILRIGAQENVDGLIRDEMTVPYSVPFEEGKYLFDTEGLVKLDLGNVEWVNYGIQAYGTEPTYLPGVRWSPDYIFDVPYEGVTLYIKINAPYEMGIRSGKTDSTMTTNYYWLNNKELTSGDKNRGYVYTIPEGHTKFTFSLANVNRDASGNVTSTVNKNQINSLELDAAGIEIWYRPEGATETVYPFSTEDKTKLDLSEVEWVNYGYKEYGAEPTYLPGVRLTTNSVFDVPYEGVTFYIKINAPYELGIRSGETDTTMTTNCGWLNNKYLSSGDSNYGYAYTIPEGHKKFVLTIGNVTRDSSNNVSTSKTAITLEELEAAGLEIWYVPHTCSFVNGVCTVCGAEMASVDLFVFAGQSNMMGAAVLEPEVEEFTDKAVEYKYMPKLRGAGTGDFVSAQNPAGEFHYIDLTEAYGDNLADLTYKSILTNYTANTYFCPAMCNGTKSFAAQSESDTYASASLAPYFVTEYANYGHSSVYTHMAKGAVKIDHYFTAEMVERYNILIAEYNSQNDTAFGTLSVDNLSGAGVAFDEKYTAMQEDYAVFSADSTVENKCFVWLQGEGDASGGYVPYKLKLQVLWEHLQELGFSHFFVLRVGYWGSTSILNVIQAQEDFCAENDNCYIITRAPSLIPHPTATTDNWWISEPSAEYDDCRDSFLVDSSNHHFNEKAMQIFAERSAVNVHRILHLGLEPILEEENIQGMVVEDEENSGADQPEDDTPYASYIGVDDFSIGLSISKPSDTWMEKTSSTAASTELIPVTSTDSIWIQYVFFKSEAHAVGGFYDEDGNLVVPLYYKDFGFSLDSSVGGITAFKTPEFNNRISIADVETAVGEKIAYVRFTAWQASAGGHANTEARVYHEIHTHSYASVVTEPTCTEQGYTTYTCTCGDSYMAGYVDATGHSYENGMCTTCSLADPDSVESAWGTWVAFGTSLTEDNIYWRVQTATAMGTYIPFLSKLMGVDAPDANYSVGGGAFSGHLLMYIYNAQFQKSGRTLYGYAHTAIKNANLITIEGSVNDFCSDVPLGKVGDTLPYSKADPISVNPNSTNNFGGTTEGTFAGCIYAAITELQKVAPDATIVFITDNAGTNSCAATKTNSLGYYLHDYNDMMAAVAESMGCYVIDAGRTAGFEDNLGTYLSDHIHHSTAGGEAYANAIWKGLCAIQIGEAPESGHVHGYSEIITTPTCNESGYTTYSCICGDCYVTDHVNATGHVYEYGVCTSCGAEISQPNWEIGTIAYATGQNRGDTNRLRTSEYLTLTDYSAVTIGKGYMLVRFVYDEDYNYLNGTSWLGDGIGFSVDALREEYPNAVYFRVALCATDGRELALDDLDDSGVMFYLPGEEVPEPDYGFAHEDIGAIGSWQDGAIWDGKLFVLGASGTGAAYDVETADKLGNLTLDKKDVIVPHANSVCFGSIYYATGDKYPLLYVNVYNNYASAEDRMEGTCCVYRITETDGVFSTELVQVIEIGFTEDLTLWKSKENNGDVRPYGNFVVDTDANQLYAFVMRDAAKTTRFFSFDIPGLEEGTYNETYGCNVVTLEQADIAAQFDTDYFNYLQGCCYSSGKIVSVEGFGGTSPLRIVDLETQTVEGTFYLGYAGLTKEPEVVCVDPVTGVLYYTAADGVLCTITLDDVHFHSYESAVSAPTCTERGYTTYTCSTCGDNYVADYMDALGHTEIIDAAIAPTCTETGLTEGKQCSVCVEMLVNQEVIPAKGHQYGDVEKIDEDSRMCECSTCGVQKIYERLTLPLYYSGEVYVEYKNEGLFYGTRNVADLLGMKEGSFTNGDLTITVEGTTISVAGTPAKTLYYDLQTGTFGVPDYVRYPGYEVPDGDYRFGLLGEGSVLPTACIRYSNGKGNVVAAGSVLSFTNRSGEDFGIPYLYLPEGKTYDFTGSLVLVMGMDASFDYDQAETNVIQGNGLFHTEHYLWSLDEDIAIFGSVGSRDTGKVKYNAGSTEYINFYLPKEEGYLQIQMNLVDNTDQNAYGWRLNMMYACDNNLNQLFPVTTSGEYEAAIKLTDRPDFMGMGAHGSEQMTSFSIYVDGVEVSLDALTTMTDWKTIQIRRESNFYDPLDETTLVATHTVVYDFDLSGLTVTQDVNWLVDETCSYSYMMMFPVRRKYNDLQITDTYFDDCDSAKYDVSEASFTTYPARWTTGVTKMSLYSEQSGILASMESLESSQLAGSGYKMCSNSTAYNKLYFTICGGGGSAQTVTAGDCWHTKHRYEISIGKRDACFLGHTEVTDEAIFATCSTTGLTEGKHCSVCNMVLIAQEVVNALGHIEVIDVAVAPTCTETGLTEGKHCSVCNEVFIDQEVADALGHDFQTYVSNNDATCTEDGTKTAQCERCDATDTVIDTDSATGHTYGDWVVTIEPDCLENGVEQHNCKDCSHFETRDVDPVGHNYSDAVIDPTCTEQGYTTHTCSNCSNVYTDTYVDALGHDFQTYVSDNNATCIADGTKTAQCERCDATDTVTDTDSVTGHSYGDWIVTTEPDCVNRGVEQHNCQNCSHFETRDIDPIGHNYSDTVIEPTCTEQGYTTHTCSNCSDVYTDTYVDALGHDFQTYVSDNNATCIADGTKMAQCERCDATDTAIDTDSATGHTYGDWVVTIEPDCLENGVEQHNCEDCSHFETRDVDPIGHNYSDAVTEPTCTEQGYTTHTCSNCGDVYTDTYVDALGHDFQTYVSDGNASYSADGTKTAQCERCDATDTIADVGSKLQLGVSTLTVTSDPSTGYPVLNWTTVDDALLYTVFVSTSRDGSYELLYTASANELTLTHTEAQIGQTYFYKICAVNADTAGEFSAIQIGYGCLPQPVVKVTNRALDGKPYISWSAVEGATSYEVYRCGTKNGTYVKMYTAAVDDLDVIHIGAAVGNDYFYTVRAIYGDNPSCNSAFSTAKGVWCDLKAPTIKVTNRAADGKPVISWAKVDYAVGYKVYCAENSTGTYTQIYSTNNPDKLSVTHIGAKAGEDYYYKVVAVHKNSKCTSAMSSYKGVYCDLARPTLTATLNSNGKPYLSWTESAGANCYKVYRSTDNSSWTLMYTAKADDLDVNHTGAKSGTTYYYKVVAICNTTSKGNSAYSAVATVTAK